MKYNDCLQKVFVKNGSVYLEVWNHAATVEMTFNVDQARVLAKNLLSAAAVLEEINDDPLW